MKLEFKVEANQDDVILRNFLRECGLSTSLLRSVKYAGGYFKNGVCVHTNEVLHSGDIISFELPKDDENIKPEDIPLDIIYEDNHAMVLNKPPFMAVHPTIGYPSSTLANAFCGEMAKRGQILPFRCIGRLDRNTSGLVLCAMNAYSAPLLEKSVSKEYIAIVKGSFAENFGTVDAPIGLEDGSFVKHCVRQDGKKSVTHFEVLAQSPQYSLLRLWLETGRTHQIRVHMAHIGHPLAGDDFYGGDTSEISRHALHCAKLTFENVENKSKTTVSAPLPQDMKAVAAKYDLL